MARRTVPKRLKMGYGLFINRTGEKGWERVGYLFLNREDARSFCAQTYPGVPQWRIEAIRVSAAKFSAATWKEVA